MGGQVGGEVYWNPTLHVRPAMCQALGSGRTVGRNGGCDAGGQGGHLALCGGWGDSPDLGL